MNAQLRAPASSPPPQARMNFLATFALALPTPSTPAQDATSPEDLAKAVGAAVREELASPAHLRRVLDRAPAGRPARLLEGLGARLFAQQSTSGGDAILGVAFDFAKSLGEPETPDSESIELVARGNLAFDDDAIPHDFTTVMVRARWFGSTLAEDGEKTRAERIAEVPDPSEAELGETTSTGEGPPDFAAQRRAHRERVFRTLPTELVWDGELRAGIEAEQDFDSRQIVFGLAAGLRPIAWNPDSALSAWNAFDAPAAALRWLAGGEYQTSGLAWPSVVLGFDVVDAAQNDARNAASDDESYLRARLEWTYRSEAIAVAGEDLHLSATWRWHQEFDAPAEIKRGELDEITWFELGLELPHGLDLTYATGRLPLDERDASVFSLGYRLQF